MKIKINHYYKLNQRVLGGNEIFVAEYVYDDLYEKYLFKCYWRLDGDMSGLTTLFKEDGISITNSSLVAVEDKYGT